MPVDTAAEISSSRNLRRLFTLRWLMLAGEFTVLLAASFLLDIALPLAPALVILALLGLVNVWTGVQIRRGTPVTDSRFLYQLGFDVAAIAGLLYFTGGATNPFAWLFLIPLMIAATVLPARATWSIAGAAIVCYSLLMRWYVPLDPHAAHMQHGDSFSQHVFGMWFGFVMTACLIAWFVAGMARSLRTRDRLLAEAREKALRDEQLVALGTLATGTAHELGTPLATMAVLTRELERAGFPDGAQRKLGILKDQIARCKSALSTLSASAGQVRAEGGCLLPVQTFVDDLLERWRRQCPDAQLRVTMHAGAGDAAIVGEQTLFQALINLLNNAADACRHELSLQAAWQGDWLDLDILDRGPGLQPQLSQQVSLPKSSDKEFGMGLGLFLAHATIQRMGGTIRLSDRDGGGTHTHIRLPLTTIRVGR